jgi:hypothetical protein
MGKPQKMGGKMIEKKILNPNRIRRINGGFSFIPHRFLTDGFLSSLEQKELLLFLFLVIVSDRNGLSFYSYDAICNLLQLNVDQYIKSRDALIEKDMIAFDGTIFQVLELPLKPVLSSMAKTDDQCRTKNLSGIEGLIDQTTKRF